MYATALLNACEPLLILSTLAERLEKALASRQITQMELEEAAGLSKGYVTKILSGERVALGPEKLRAMADYLEVNYSWLAIDRGPMYGDSAPAGATSPRLERVLQAGQYLTLTSMQARARFHSDGEDLTEQDWKVYVDGLDRENRMTDERKQLRALSQPKDGTTLGDRLEQENAARIAKKKRERGEKKK